MRNTLISLIMLIACTLTSCSTSTFYVVRHAERQSATDDTTPLSAAGLTRANTLADSLRNKGIDSVYSTNYLRCTQTAGPTAEHVPIVLYKPHPPTEIVNRVKNLKNMQLLIVGHSNTVLEIVKGFGTMPTLTTIQSSDYDNLFIVTIQKKLGKTSVSLKETTYGVATQ